MNSVADLWANVINQLKSDLSETSVNTWFNEITPLEIRGNTFFLHCPNDFHLGYIESLFMKNIKACLFNIFSIEFEVTLLSNAELAAFQGAQQPKANHNNRFTSDEFTFETFVVGPSNKLAYAASRAVADQPAQHYNPLLIYGDSGLGKTHLLYAIANVIKANDSTAKIAYVKGDDLTNELVTAIQEGKAGEMREKYRQADLLLVDDVQFIAGKIQTQEEFFHTFNTLYESGKQIVLTSDRPPSEMAKLEDRLRSRFEWGLPVDVSPPDFETRMAIIKNKSASLGMDLPERIITFIAENVTANVRQIEGVINKILAYKDLLGDATDEITVTRAIQDILKKANEYMPSKEEILDYISKYFKQEPAVIRGQQRMRDAVTARHISIYLTRTLTNISLVDIGKYYDNRDHSTVLYSVSRVEKQMKKDPAYAEMIKEMKANLSKPR